MKMLKNKETSLEDKLCNEVAKLCGAPQVDHDDL